MLSALRMDTGVYFKALAALMKDNPSAAVDAPIVAKMAKLGVIPGKDFDASKLDPAVAKAAFETIAGNFMKMAVPVNGWVVSTKTALYGTRYLDRATTAAVGPGANRPQDAVYPTSTKDGDGKAYDAANTYVMHFDKGQAPPVNGFWSLTMYNAEYFFVENPLNRSTLSSRSSSSTTRTARSISISRTSRRARTRSRTGCRPRRVASP